VAKFSDIKAKAKLPERSVPLCLTGDLQGQFEDLERQLDEVSARPGGRTMAGASEEETALAKRIEALRQQMADEVTVFRLRALPRGKWRDLMAEHPPRPEDKAEGSVCNLETGPIAAVAACCVDPQMSIPEVEELVDEILTQGQWDTLFQQVFLLNRVKHDVPSSSAASGILRSSTRS